MSLVAPTITAENPHIYRSQIEAVQSFASRIHVDIMDGIFTPNKSLEVSQVWLPDNITCDIHIMFEYPLEAVRELLGLDPNMIIVPAESKDDFDLLAEMVHEEQIKFGVALLHDTQVKDVTDAINLADHVLIFSGNLGHQGGSSADLSLLVKISQIKAINPTTEIGWDGGVNDENVQQISEAGVEVISVGGFIHHADKPEERFRLLEQKLAK